MTFDNRIKAAIRAEAAPVPEDFLWKTEQMIDRLPRKERIIVRNKLSVGLILTIILCMLTLTAVAAALLTGWELVQQEVLPMAVENDSGSAPLTFTSEQLQYIADLAARNGVTLGENTRLALENGLDIREDELVRELAYNAFGPEPLYWSLEEQYWFHEAMVQLGVQKTNDHLLPGKDDLTEKEAIALALEHLSRQPDEYDRKNYLDDPDNYTVTRSYQKANDVHGNPVEKAWLIGFVEKDGPSWYQVLMDGEGKRIGVFWQDMTERSDVNTTFSNEELARIVALAEDNGITLSDNILRALEMGEGYWEQEVIMALAKAQFGPIPGQWTIEEQYWFEEMMIAIGFKEVNCCRLPAEGEMTYEDAYARAVALLQAEGWVDDPAWLDDRTLFDLHRTYEVSEEFGDEPMWNFIFEPKQLDLPTLSVLMTATGEVEGIGRMPGLSEQLAAGMPAISVIDVFTDVYGSVPSWTPEVFVAYVEALRQSDLSRSSQNVRLYLATEYILPPEGALTSEEAIAIAVQHLCGDSAASIRVGGAYCFRVDGGQPGSGGARWKITIALDNNRISDMVELDAMTGEILEAYKTDPDGNGIQFYIPRQVYEAPIPATPEPPSFG